MRARTALLVLILICQGLAWAGGKPDIEWIETLQGVHQTSATTTDGQQTRTYKVGDPLTVYADLRQNLARRGWQITSSPQVSTAGAFVGTMVAVKGAYRLEITTHAVSGLGGSMVVVVTGVGGATVTAPSTSSAAAASGPLTINESNQHKIVDMNGPLTVNGSNNHLTVTGTCTRLTLNASNCKIEFTGRIESITMNGSHNAVHWSSAANQGQPPALHDNGSFNTCQRQ